MEEVSVSGVMKSMNTPAIKHKSLSNDGLLCLRKSPDTAGVVWRFSEKSYSAVRGFSLLEVLLVLVLAGILMGTLATSLSDGPVLRKSAHEVAASLRHARSIAILRQQPVIWSMNIQSREFWTQGESQGVKRSFHDSVSAKINTAASEVVSSNQGNIRFFPDGSSTGGSVELVVREQTYKVNVEWISGRISVL